MGKKWFYGDPTAPKPPTDPELQIPNEIYNHALHRCFDACITSFANKMLLNEEKECLNSCMSHWKEHTIGY